MPESKRLHISPFNPALLPIVLPKAILPLASDISYHSIQSSPERNYGYVTLPAVEADKVQKKLNGSILKGAKMHVGEARPRNSKRKLENGESEKVEGSTTKKARKEKGKSKREEGILPGVELPQERKVKRGWTEPEAPADSRKAARGHRDKHEKKSKSKSKPSSFTDKAELLFKTTVPPNAAPLEDEEPGTKKKSKKKKKGESSHDVVVHEFTNTARQPAFLRDSQAANGKNGASEFVEGKGWVDEAGKIIEAEPKTRRTRSKAVEQQPVRAAEGAKKKNPSKDPESDIPSIGLTTSTSTSPKLLNDDETSSSGTSTTSSSSSSSSPAHKPENGDGPAIRPSSPSPSSSSTKSTSPRLNRLSITRSSATPPPKPKPDPTSASSPPGPHPLSTLFKRPLTAASATTPARKPNLEVTTSFSFFDPDVDEAPLTGVGLLAPQTPFTRRDLSERGQRSAAPTPDTAMPGKSFWGFEREKGDEEDGDVSAPEEGDKGYGLGVLEEEDGEPMGRGKGDKGEGEEKEESEFAKEFWEKRGERNRAAKRRVREAKKEKRRADNLRRRG
ncbi:MAG: hypothetical protein HETSPECPRED_008730 [Heterodermia speciosa]|uniref:Uncharacterized protein n=1 Tax=Heterodermia speciosa TaxID=116794 RepID=A0A8H3FZ37_9LECA|nr:MAG: hypothetical protein HETSPECPRED_008730 [Heterodermia speciosa]